MDQTFPLCEMMQSCKRFLSVNKMATFTYAMFVCLFVCLFQQYFSYIVAVSFIGGGNQSTRRSVASHWQTLSHNVVHLALIEWLIDWFLVFSATFSNISAISWRPALVVEEVGVPGENHRPWASNWQLINFITCGCESSALFVIYKAGCEPTPYWW
jgi:hypothetical protein